jgi:hypothetical protein
MNKKFTVGMRRSISNLFEPGSTVVEVVSRTDKAVTVKEDDFTGYIRYDVELDKYGVEVAQVWEYKGHKGYIAALTDNEYEQIIKENDAANINLITIPQMEDVIEAFIENVLSMMHIDMNEYTRLCDQDIRINFNGNEVLIPVNADTVERLQIYLKDIQD